MLNGWKLVKDRIQQLVIIIRVIRNFESSDKIRWYHIKITIIKTLYQFF